jgi:hypothetical protein
VGISHLVSCPHAHQQNGPAERKHRHIVEVGLSLLAYASMPLKYWDEAFHTAVYLINRLPGKVIQSHTPMERLFGNSGDYSLLRVFGCACWPNLRPYNRHKLDFRSKQCTFLGYSNLHKGYKCLDISTGRMYISHDIVFDETVFLFSSLHSNAGARLRDEINLLPLSLQPLNMHYHEGIELQEPVDVNPANAPNPAAESFVQNSDHNFTSDDESRNNESFGAEISDQSGTGTTGAGNQPCPASGSPAVSIDSDVSSHKCLARESGAGPALDCGRVARGPGAGPADNEVLLHDTMRCDLALTPGGPRSVVPIAELLATHGSVIGSSTHSSADTSQATGSGEAVSSMAVPALQLDRPRTRLQSGVSKPKQYTDGTIRYANFCSTGEPSTNAEAFSDSRWKAAMDEEYNALISNQTWHLVPPTRGQHVIDCKWVYKIKRKADGTIDRYKARLVAKVNNNTELTMKKLLVLLSNLLLSMWFCRLQFHEVGIYDS